MSQDQNLTAQGGTVGFTLKPGQSATYSIGGTFTGFGSLQRSRNGGASWETVTTGAEDTAISGTVKNETTSDEAYRGYLADTDALTVATGTLEVSFADVADVLHRVVAPDGTVVLQVTDEGIVTPKITPSAVARTSQKRVMNAGVLAKAATSSGWTVDAVDSVCVSTLAQSLSTKALVVPVTGLKVGDTITGFHLIGQVESAGNNVTIDAALRKHTAAAADVADASVGAMTQVVVAADTILSASNTRKASLSEVVAADETFYVLITGTTGAATDIALQGVAIEITEA